MGVCYRSQAGRTVVTSRPSAATNDDHGVWPLKYVMDPFLRAPRYPTFAHARLGSVTASAR
jgi:hypothetical protein